MGEAGYLTEKWRKTWLSCVKQTTQKGADNGYNEQQWRLCRKGRVRDRGGERHWPCDGVGVRARGGQRGGRRRVRAGQPGNSPPDRGARRAGARRPVRRNAGRGREGGSS